MASEIRVNSIKSRAGLGTWSVSDYGLSIAGIITATQLNVGTGVTISAGIISATEFRGSGANLTGVSPFVAGTLMLFQQTAAPTGWTKQTTHNNKALRVVTGAASSGGTTAFTSVFALRTPAGTLGATTLTTAQIPSHSHTASVAIAAPGAVRFGRTGSAEEATPSTNATGGGGSHDHSFTGTAMDFDVQYVDLIIASKD